MIRWWDYIAAFLCADLMTALLFIGFTATDWFVAVIAGLLVGFVWTSWRDFYCHWRLEYEESRR